ncbi:protein phosphatase 2C domain-containing protein [uncultured Paracoccus sp.]|uniref:PP2C family protein-serine/threonine phosphatase n=1 Tax=uncultured Paracoccus sp. TaxID=189685 RepID=UPI0025E654B5|nr:protein phosphatase 2C domain-containing protein [uncultured Paracoccus sp.]
MTGDETGFHFVSGACSHKGMVRAHNEDAHVMLPGTGIWVVADGMGGHEAGDIASRLIVEEISSVGLPVSAQDQRARFSQRLIRANERILAHAQARNLSTVGSTVAALMIHGHELACTWAGDSRVYLLRKGLLTRLTTDHSEVARLIAAGELTEEEARRSPSRNVITRAIGIQLHPNPETVTGVVEPNDLFLLCSDGLTEHNSDDDLRQMLLQPGSPETLARRLIEQTLARGARDNVTAIVMCCQPVEARDDAGE